jgi:hypothetical protein
LQKGHQFELVGGSGVLWTVDENEGNHVVVSSPSSYEGRTWLADMEVKPYVRATPIRGFVVITDSLPECDICISQGAAIPNRAPYDARTTGGPWAYVCEEHFATETDGTLGEGSGQYLVPSEFMEAGGTIPENVVLAIQKARA